MNRILKVSRTYTLFELLYRDDLFIALKSIFNFTMTRKSNIIKLKSLCLKWTNWFSGIDYRVASLPENYQTAKGIFLENSKSIGHS